MNGALSKIGLNRNKFCLRKANKFGDPLLLTTIVPKYAPSCFMHQRCYTCNMKTFLDFTNEARTIKGSNRNELCLHKINKLKEPLLLAIIVAKYAPNCFMHQRCYTWNVTTLTLGLWPRQGHGKMQAKNATRESHLHSQECEKMNPYTPKWTPTLGIGFPMESPTFKKLFQGSKIHWINSV